MDEVVIRECGRLARAGVLASVSAAVGLLGGIAALMNGQPVLRNWLAVLFGINSGFGGVSPATLRSINASDMALLVLASVTFAGFWPGPARRHRIWMGLAIGLPLAGIAVLVATGVSGRSGLMGGGIVLGILMLGDRASRPLGYVGIAGNALLLVGDFATLGPRAPVVAAAVGVGYASLVVWFCWMARVLVVRRPPSSESLHA